MEIFKAAQQNKLQRVKFLVEKKGIPVNVTNKKQKTIAHIAVRNSNLDMLDYVLTKDPSLLTKTDNHDSTVLQLAVERGELDIVRYLVEKRNANVFDKHIRDHNITGTAIHRAIKYGHQNILRYFIEGRKIDVDEPVADQVEPPLLLAMKFQNMDIVEYLIDVAKAKLTVSNSDGENILFLALQKGNINFMKDLLNDNAEVFDINWKRVDGKTLVHIAVIEKQMKTLKYLVEKKKADVNVADNDQNTPLHYAVFSEEDDENAYKYFKYLIMHDADMSKKNKDGMTPPSLYSETHSIQLPFEVVYRGDLDFLKWLLDKTDFEFDINTELFGHETLFETAFELGEPDIMSYLVKEKHAVVSQTWLNTKLLELAGKREKTRCDYLIELGADIKHADQEGNTILHKYWLGNEWVDYLIDHGCDINQKNNEGNTPLHLSVLRSDFPACRYYIKRGSDINQKNNKGETPLYLSVSLDRPTMFEYLLEQGADINQKNNLGETPLHLAAAQGQRKICEYLIKEGANVNQKNKRNERPILLALLNNHQEIFTYLADCGAIIDDSADKTTCTHIAAEKNQIIALKYLITKKKADVNVVRKGDNWTPLHCAAFGKHEEIFQYLIEQGANMEAKDIYGKTPLQVVYNQKFLQSVGEILKKRSRRSVGEFFHPSSYRNENLPIPNYSDQLRITGNIHQNFFTLSNAYAPHFQNFVTIFCSIVRNFYYPVHAMSTDEETIFSTGVIRQYRKNPMIEKAIRSLPEFKE